MISFKSFEQPIRGMREETRKTFLPRHNVCCTVPAAENADDLITGNTSHWIYAAGHPYREQLRFSQELLYKPLWDKTPMPPDFRPILPQMRSLLLQGRYKEVDELIDSVQLPSEAGKFMFLHKGMYMVPAPPPHRHTAFRLNIDQPEQPETWDYLRWLDTQTGLISSRWTNGLGTFTTESFAACGPDYTVTRLCAPAGKLNAELTVHTPLEDMPDRFANCTQRLDVTEERLVLAVAYEPEFGRKGYVSVVRFLPTGGTVTRTGAGVRVQDADSLIVLTRTVPFAGDFDFDCADAVEAQLMAVEPDLPALLEGNAAYIGARMDRSRIHLGDPEDYALSGEELLRRNHSEREVDPMLLEKLYDMGRFFQIYDTGKTIPPAAGQHNINTNLQVCAGNNTGLFDEMDVYVRFYESNFDDFRTNARLLFGARGLLASIHCDPDSGLMYHFSHTYPHYCWTGCLGWIYNELWGYYLITEDEEFLRDRLVPALKEMALFFEDYACDRGPDGKVIFYPSFSPEDSTPYPGGESANSINSVMDIAIAREVLTNLLFGCRKLGIEQENIPHWEKQLEDLPTYLLDEEGALKEWAWPTIAENYNHRHVSHHYDVWPGRAVTPETEPELAEAIRLSNRKRGQQDDSAHGIIHRAFTAIRLKDEPEAMANLTQLMNHGFVRSTLQTNHFPYRMFFPDLLGAMPALLAEMCVFSMPGVVEFLPVMPKDLAVGSVEGIWLYTCAKLENMNWDEKGVRARLRSDKAQTLTLRCRRNISRFLINGCTALVQGDHTTYTFAPGETVDIEIQFV